MGWLFLSECETRKDLLAYLRRPARYGESCELLRSSQVGNHHWYLARSKADGTVFIGLDLMQGGTARDRSWGFKDLCESMGPSAVDCPISYLKLASPPTGHAAEWRERVIKYHMGKKTRVALEAGDKVVFNDIVYTLLRRGPPRKGWVAQGDADGIVYSLKPKILSRCEIRPAITE